MSSSCAMVMCSPLGTSGRYLDTGSSRLILPSSTSCRITVPVHVLVLLPTRTWSASPTGSVPCHVRVPIVVVQLPCSGDRTRTTAPVTAMSLTSRSSSGSTARAYAGSPDGAAAAPVDAPAMPGLHRASTRTATAADAVTTPADQGRRGENGGAAGVMNDLPTGPRDTTSSG